MTSDVTFCVGDVQCPSCQAIAPMSLIKDSSMKLGGAVAAQPHQLLLIFEHDQVDRMLVIGTSDDGKFLKSMPCALPQ